uniref:hypothetical protein n=1 Tax=Thiofilum flexile TaxID=125627 RepID=UPI00047646A1
RESGSPLPPPSTEQRSTAAYGIIDMLTKAKTALSTASSTFMSTRLADLQETAIRSFSMKRIAIRNGTVQPLLDLGTLNARREAMLKWLLTTTQLGNMTLTLGEIRLEVLDADTQQPIVDKQYVITSNIDNPVSYFGITDSNGTILLSDIPIGSYTVSFKGFECFFIDI